MSFQLVTSIRRFKKKGFIIKQGNLVTFFSRNLTAWALCLFFVFGVGELSLPGEAGTFIGTVPTGLLELQDFRYPVFFYVPENYDPSRKYVLLIAMPPEGEKADQTIKEWAGFAKRKNLMVLVPGLRLRDEDVSPETDQWFLKLKKSVTERYQVDPQRTYLVGKGKGAHYAAYLGILYPQEFSAIAMIDGSFAGPYEKRMRPETKPRKQRPFFVAIEETKTDLIQRTETAANRFTKRGYPIYFEKIKTGDVASEDLKKRLFDWCQDKSASWYVIVHESEKPLKEKLSKGFEGLFKVT